MDAEFDRLISTQWGFLHQDWPILKRSKFHRTEIKSVENIEKAKDFVQHRLGIVPVFFFLTVIFGTRNYPGPYRNVEKGILILYMLLKGVSTSEMSVFLPKSSFHDVYKDFFGRETHTLDSKLTSCLANMSSSITLRLLTSRSINPEEFKHITLHIDGHDSRVAYLNADKASLYSYKLKKSGFRTQVCCDMNSMIVFVSQPAECRDFSDGTMLSKMAIEKKIDRLDCITLDGGYSQFLHGIIEHSDQLESTNFCCPVRKTRGIAFTDQEKKYNEMVGSFRSRIESYFGEMQTIFTKFSHTVVKRVSEKSIFSLQFKLCCLLLNIKRMVALRNITIEPHHSFWMQENFDYPDGTEANISQIPTAPSYVVEIKDARSMYQLQDAFLNLGITTTSNVDNDHEMGDSNIETAYEIKKIIEHRGEGDGVEYLVQWKGYNKCDNSWEPLSSFNQTRAIDDYWNSKREF
ncbi:hypothetical protein BX616_010751 [Lobosporangium transversale]|nr:hypothetical protein BX616_010751 [Lobosporangium transversale]